MPTSKGLVFDIKRFAVHDGDGLRTTVFLKGCPLRCQWCQNPEGLRVNTMPVWFDSKCIHCASCAQCSHIDFKEGRPHFMSDEVDEAVDACPAGAIRYDSRWYDVPALMKEIRKDEVFFRHDGGVTFSGGEPFLQYGFLLEMLKECKKAGLHTAIESSFYTSLDNVKAVLPYLDRIYCDLKVFDDTKHQEFTSVSNEGIKENLAFLLSGEHASKVIVRTPLIPDRTATIDNVKAIAGYISTLFPDVRYELLNYNPLASSKYELYDDLEYRIGNVKQFTKEEMEQFRAAAKQAGVKHIVME